MIIVPETVNSQFYIFFEIMIMSSAILFCHYVACGFRVNEKEKHKDDGVDMWKKLSQEFTV